MPLKKGWIIVAAIVALLIYFSTYTITEGQQALLLRLGTIETDTKGNPLVENPGLHFKIPFITQVKLFDMRLQTLDIQSSRIVTAEQKDVIVDYYAKWRINNVVLYYTRTSGDPQQASLLLEQQLNDGLRAEFGRRTISDVVSDDRATIMNALSQQANANAERLGISVIDVRIKRIDLPDEVSTAVFERMRTERERVATEHRSDGKANAEAIRANADASASVALATAKMQAAAMRAQSDKQASVIYTAAYSKDPEFYAFWRSLEAYKAVFANSANTLLVLKPDSAFFKYFNNLSNNGRPMPKEKTST
jgi:membrane protease subunit HflC